MLARPALGHALGDPFHKGLPVACPNDSHKCPDIPQRLKTFHAPSGEPSSGVKHTDALHLHSRPSLQLLDDLKQVTPRTEPLLGGPGKKVQFKMINFVTDRLVWKSKLELMAQNKFLVIRSK